MKFDTQISTLLNYYLYFFCDHLILHLELYYFFEHCDVGDCLFSVSGSALNIFEPYAADRDGVSAIGVCLESVIRFLIAILKHIGHA